MNVRRKMGEHMVEDFMDSMAKAGYIEKTKEEDEDEK